MGKVIDFKTYKDEGRIKILNDDGEENQEETIEGGIVEQNNNYSEEGLEDLLRLIAEIRELEMEREIITKDEFDGYEDWMRRDDY